MFYFEFIQKQLKKCLFKIYLQKLFLQQYIYGIAKKIRDCTKKKI